MSEMYRLIDGSLYEDNNQELHNCCFPMVAIAVMTCAQSAQQMAPGDMGFQTDIMVFSSIATIEAFKMRYALTVDSEKVRKMEKIIEAAMVWKLKDAAANVKLLDTARATGVTDQEFKSYRGLFMLVDMNGNFENIPKDVEEKCIREYVAICIWLARNIIASAIRRGYNPFPLTDVMCEVSPKISRFYEVFKSNVDEAKF